MQIGSYGNSVGRMFYAVWRMFASGALGSVLYVVVSLSVLSAVQIASAAEPAKAIQGAVAQHFATVPDFRPGDLVRQADLAAILKSLEKTGLDVKRFAGLEQRIPVDSSEIQRLNSDSKGRPFLRELAAVPGGYASVEDLASRPQGVRDLRQLVKTPDGAKLISYMATTSGGKKMMAMTPQRRSSRAVRKEEPRIYTASDLQQALVQRSRAEPAAAVKRPRDPTN